MEEEQLTERIMGCAMASRVYREFGIRRRKKDMKRKGARVSNIGCVCPVTLGLN